MYRIDIIFGMAGAASVYFLLMTEEYRFGMPRFVKSCSLFTRDMGPSGDVVIAVTLPSGGEVAMRLGDVRIERVAKHAKDGYEAMGRINGSLRGTFQSPTALCDDPMLRLIEISSGYRPRS